MVVYADDFGHVFGQCSRNKEAVDSLYNDMATFYHAGQGEPVDQVHVGECYVSQFSDDNEWYRAQVTSIDSSAITVTLLL